MAALNLFISHSSKTDSNILLLKNVCDGLNDRQLTSSTKKVKVVYDQNGTIVGGDDWYSKIDRWMKQANAAVILFSKAALFDSDWVKKEVSILTWRNNLEKDFRLIPVLLEDLDPTEFEKGLFGVLNIGKRQCIRSQGNVAEICNKIIASLSANEPVLNRRSNHFSGCSYEPLEGILAESIKNHSTKAAIINAVSKLNLNLPDWSDDELECNALAASRFILEEPQMSIRNLIEFLDSVNPRFTSEQTKTLIDYVKGIWVDHSSAVGILEAWQEQNIIGLNGKLVASFTAERYCERVWPLSQKWMPIIRVNNLHTSRVEIQSDIDSVLVRKDKNPTDKRIQDRIRESNLTYIILIPFTSLSDGPDNNITAQLRNRYKGAVIIVDLGSGQHEWLSDTYIRPLSPLLDVDIEQKQFDALEDVQNYLT
jgi:hypothetical protein